VVMVAASVSGTMGSEITRGGRGAGGGQLGRQHVDLLDLRSLGEQLLARPFATTPDKVRLPPALVGEDVEDPVLVTPEPDGEPRRRGVLSWTSGSAETRNRSASSSWSCRAPVGG
jgi:hypothetical protein